MNDINVIRWDLTFGNHVLEAIYRGSMERVATVHDTAGHFLCGLGYLSLIWNWAWRASSTCHMALAVSTCCLFPLLGVLSARRPELYRKHRNRLLMGVVAFQATAIHLLHSIPPADFASMRILGSMVFKSPLWLLVLSAIVFRMPFKVLAQRQTISVIACLGWVHASCRTCSKTSDCVQLFNYLGLRIDEIAGFSTAVVGFLFPSNSSGSYPCWVTGYFLHIGLGWILPLACMYGIEWYSRVCFWKSHVSLGLSRKMFDGVWVCGAWVVKFCFIVWMSTWLLLCALHDAF